MSANALLCKTIISNSNRAVRDRDINKRKSASQSSRRIRFDNACHLSSVSVLTMTA